MRKGRDRLSGGDTLAAPTSRAPLPGRRGRSGDRRSVTRACGPPTTFKRADHARDRRAGSEGWLASARRTNGGGVSGFLLGTAERYERRAGREGYGGAKKRACSRPSMRSAASSASRLEADFVQGWASRVVTRWARSRPRRQPERVTVASARERGPARPTCGELSGEGRAARLRVAGAQAAIFRPRRPVHPAKLRAAAAAVERLGVRIHERTRYSEIHPRAAHTPARDREGALGGARDRGYKAGCAACIVRSCE